MAYRSWPRAAALIVFVACAVVIPLWAPFVLPGEGGAARWSLFHCCQHALTNSSVMV
jgi:hypothetical protein